MAKKKPASEKPKSKPSAPKAPENSPPPFEARLLEELQALKEAQASAPAREKKEIPKGTYDPEAIELYYQKGECSYWMKEYDEQTKKVEYVKYKSAQLMRRFRYLGMTERIYKRGLREIDWPFHVADMHNKIDYCGPLAGHRAGEFVDEGGQVFLVTKGPVGVWDPLPALPKGDHPPPFISAFTIEAFQQPGEWEHVNHWCAKSLSSLIRGDFRPGPALGLAGEPECGKSLFQWMLTQLFGGRSAKPWRYLMGEEKHNYDIVTAEHLIISDPPATTDLRSRRAFGNNIKDVLFEEEQRVRAMNKDALNAPVWHRLSIAVNDETENLMVFPPIDRSLRDKISLIKFSKVVDAFKQFDMPENQLAIELREVSETGLAVDAGDQDRSAIKRTIRREIPHWRAWLLKKWLNVPHAFDRAQMGTNPRMRTRRTGLCAYQNPELMEALTSHSPEVQLMDWIDQVFFNDPVISEITKRALDIEKELIASEFGAHAERLLARFPTACGTYLGRAMSVWPDRISRGVKHGGVPVWTIKAPPKPKEETE